VQPLLSYAVMAALAATRLIPWTFFIAAVIGPALTIPLWRGMFHRGFHHETKGPNMGAVSRTFLIYTLVSLAAWSAGTALR